MRTNKLILQTATKAVVFTILAFSVYLLLAGHNRPGGGFIGGLMASAAIILVYLAFDLETIKRTVPLDFRILIGVGILISALTGIGGVMFGYSFLTQSFDIFSLPIIGEVELATATIFDLGVYLTVVGATVTVISAIGEDI